MISCGYTKRRTAVGPTGIRRVVGPALALWWALWLTALPVSAKPIGDAEPVSESVSSSIPVPSSSALDKRALPDTTLAEASSRSSAAAPSMEYRLGQTAGLRGVAVKLNGLAVIGVVNPAVEIALGRHITTQVEAYGVFAHRNFLGTGLPLALGMGFVEGRYYIKESFRGFYAGANAGWGVWKMNKDLVPGWSYGHDTVQYGENVMLGLSLGFHWIWGRHWSLDLNLAGGWHIATYDGFRYDKDNGVWVSYDDPSLPEGARNQSAEWLPAYKGGAYFTYRF